MALPFRRSVGELVWGTGPVSVPLPLGWQEGDIFVMVVATAFNEGTAASGWLPAPDSPADSGSGGCRVSVFYRRATTSEGAASLVDSGDHQVARIVAYGGCVESGDPWGVTNAGFTGETEAVTIPGETTPEDDMLCLVAMAVANDLDVEGFVASWTNADLANIEEVFDHVKDIGNGGGISLIQGEKATAGVVGDTTATKAAAGAYAGWFGALLPGTDSGSGSEEPIESEEPASEEPEEPPNESDEFGVDTWQFDTPETDPNQITPVDWWLAFQLMDNAAESRSKVLTAVRVTGKLTGPQIQLHSAGPGETISPDDIDNGVNALETIALPSSTVNTRYERIKRQVKNLTLWTLRISGTSEDHDNPDQLHEIICEGSTHGTDR